MPARNQLPYVLPGLKIKQVTQEGDGIIVTAHCLRVSVPCPLCGTRSRSIHSHYVRTLHDLPCSGRPVHLRLTIRRFRCRNRRCLRRIFAERIPEIAPSHAQRTDQLTRLLRALVFEMSAEATARISCHFKAQVSADTLLRILRQTELPASSVPRVLGVDDWALKKGQRYGTVLVDLEARRAIELLPDRSAETLAHWLKKHPGAEIICRDRAHDYIAGISQGAPDAIQVADRWHLLLNLREALQRLLELHSKLLRSVARQVAGEPEPGDSEDGNISTDVVPTARERRFAAVKRLAAEGYSQRAIARHLHLGRSTVRRYLRRDEIPRWQSRRARTWILQPFIPYLEMRWTAGCHNALQLWHEIQQQGYSGSYATLTRFLRPYRKVHPRRQRFFTAAASRVPSTCQVSWLLMQSAEHLTPAQLHYRNALCQASTELESALALVGRPI